jgi:hypothetical protein
VLEEFEVRDALSGVLMKKEGGQTESAALDAKMISY